MIESNKKISVSQLLCILILSRLSAEIVFPKTLTNNAFEFIAALVISEIGMFILALPIILYSFHGKDLWGAIYRKNRVLGWLSSFLGGVLLVGASLFTLFYSAEFTVKNLLIGAYVPLLFIICAIFSIYAAIMGAESLARAGVIFLLGAVIITVAVILGDVPYIEVWKSEFEPYVDFGNIWNEVKHRTIRGGDYLIFSAMLPFVNRKNSSSVGKCGLMFGLISVVSTMLLGIACVLVLREMFTLSEYPLIAAASLSDIAIFKRLDGAAAAVWVLAAVFRSGLALLCAWKIIERVYGASTNRKKEGTP